MNIIKTRMEKVNYGNMWAVQRTYKIKNKVIGTIIKNPYTEKYESMASDFVNHKYIKGEFDKLSQAKKFIFEKHNVKQINNSNNELVSAKIYGEIKHFSNIEEAKKYFLQAMHSSEGSERERYTRIYYQLKKGLRNVSDVVK